ncbi:GNAT family N-acetyltransferase [Clostridium algidicarnis]|uniref:GNAT family N-acetyltransferase n=1 Tax=Clostridium algidicarnis TaxID=37659 RepID=UPI001C0E279A|nr:GNAT family N-acetyltransferase [Clostridium algidicarnis]MBU3196749.1 GNAT family N-acetyltransferase [Clostridium algidicarnis]
MKIEGIETKRLNLRNYEKTDVDFIISIWNDPEMGKYMPDPSIENVDEEYRKAYETLEEDEECCYLISEYLETGERIGTCSFVVSEDGASYDLGYCVHMRFWRNGYGTEMVQGMIDYAKIRGAKTITAPVNKKNVASKAIMRKLGFNSVGESKFKKMGTDIIMESYLYCLEL